MKTCADEPDDPGSLPVPLQPFQEYAPSLDRSVVPSAMRVFICDEPIRVDPFDLIGSELSVRGCVFSWRLGPSDLSGAVEFSSPVVLLPRGLRMHSPSVLVLCLVDALLEHEFVPVYRSIDFDGGAPKLFDIRSATSKGN